MFILFIKILKRLSEYRYKRIQIQKRLVNLEVVVGVEREDGSGSNLFHLHPVSWWRGTIIICYDKDEGGEK